MGRLKESSLKIELLLLLLRFDAHLGVELVCNMSVLGESLGGNQNRIGLQPQIWEMIEFESKQCEDELYLVLLFDSIFIAGAGVLCLQLKMKG